MKQSADAYEISRRSLLKRVLKVLGDQDSCLVRLKHGFDLRVTSSDGDLDAEIGSLYATLSDKIVVGSAANAEAKSPLEFERLVELYNAAARAAAVEPKVVVQVDEGADDQIFREALSALARQDYRSIGLLLKQTKEEKEEAQQSVGGQPATPPRVGD